MLPGTRHLLFYFRHYCYALVTCSPSLSIVMSSLGYACKSRQNHLLFKNALHVHYTEWTEASQNVCWIPHTCTPSKAQIWQQCKRIGHM